MNGAPIGRNFKRKEQLQEIVKKCVCVCVYLEWFAEMLINPALNTGIAAADARMLLSLAMDKFHSSFVYYCLN